MLDAPLLLIIEWYVSADTYHGCYSEFFEEGKCGSLLERSQIESPRWLFRHCQKLVLGV